MRREIQFLRNGRTVRIDAPGTLTLLDYLRLNEHATGTKEGCAEGDCGACTVVLRRLVGGKIGYQTVNSCVLMAGQADGCDVITVEDLTEDGRLHPVQQALVDTHGSQCGFCTPGFVMALFGLYHAPQRGHLDRDAVNDWIAGNLCRCTGYRPIVDAALKACGDDGTDKFALQERETAKALAALDDGADVFAGSDARFFAAPASVAALAALYQQHPDATLIGGATDVGLWITKQMRDLPKLIWLGRVNGLDAVEETEAALVLGAGVPHEVARKHFAAIDPDLGEMMRRFASVQVRNAGTIGGNIANGSPIGDTPPALIALGATLTLQMGDKTRTLPLEDFFIDYGKQDRAKGEFVRSVSVPKLKPDERFRCYKISKRFDQDISTVLGAFKFTLDGRTVADARTAFGGMAGTPKRAAGTEAALRGLDLGKPATWDAAISKLDADFKPLTDQRGSSAYRSDVARALLRKALTEIAGAPTHATRVTGIRETAGV